MGPLERFNVGWWVVSWVWFALAGAPAPPTTVVDHARFDAILRDVVIDERVDYVAVRERHLGGLDAYLRRLATADLTGLGRAERLALHINLYNATMIRAVVERYHPGYSPAADSFAVFDEPLVRVAGRRLSLNDLEHRIIRPEFGEPRVHAALVCAARSCPPLLPQAYTGENLERLLEQNMRRFIADRSRNRIDGERRTLHLSQIFEWYAEDFGGAASVVEFVDRYTDVDVSGFAVEFIPYSWELNDASRAAPGAAPKQIHGSTDSSSREARATVAGSSPRS